MRALVVRQHGPDPDVLQFEDRPKPDPRAGQVRVKMHAVSLNHLDIWVRRGIPGQKFPLPIVPGSDGAGVVDALGADTSGQLAVGARVVLSPGFGCGLCSRCASGQEHLCRRYGILGETCDGTNQEFLCVPERQCLPIPEGLDFAEAAAVPLVFLTAWHMLVDRCCARAGDTVLVHAAGSGVSSAAIQIAKLIGCTVLATAGQEHKLALATRLGADHTINYRTEDWFARARELAPGGALDFVVDHVGAETFGKSLALLRKGGAVVTCGSTSGAKIELNMARVFFLGLSILGSTMGSLGELHRVLALVGEGRLRPVVDTVLPWERFAEAHHRMEAREVAGKMVLNLAPDPMLQS